MKFQKSLIATVLTIAALLNSGSAAALAPSVKIEVSNSVVQSTAKNSVEKSKKIKSAINIGNEFLRQVFDGRARDEMALDWEATTGVLVAMSDTELFAMLDGLSNEENVYFRTCQPVRLAGVDVVGDAVQLTYRSLIIGLVRWDQRKEFYHHSTFVPERQGEEVVITISVNRNQRVASIATNGMAIPLLYFPGRPSISAYINKKAFLNESPESIKARSATHLQAGRELQEAADKVCNIKVK